MDDSDRLYFLEDFLTNIEINSPTNAIEILNSNTISLFADEDSEYLFIFSFDETLKLFKLSARKLNSNNGLTILTTKILFPRS